MQNVEIEIPPEVFNDAFFPLLFDDARILCCKGSAGSGKSWFIAQKWVYRFLHEQNHRVPLVRKVGRTIRDSQYKLILDVINQWNLSQYFDIRDSDMRIYCRLTNSEFFALGVDDREKVKSLQKPTGMWIEEVTELDYSDYRQLVKRVRGKATEGTEYKQITLTFNPIENEHWIHEELFPPVIDQKLFELEEQRSSRRRYTKGKWIPFKLKEVSARMVSKVKVFYKGVEQIVELTHTLHHSTYEDNAHLDLDDIATLEEEKEKDYNSWLIYAKGRWGSIGNLVFNPAWKITNEFPENYDDVVFGLDFGYNHPSALAECRIRDNVWYVKQLIYVKKFTNTKLIEYTKENCNLPEGALIYADSAEPARIDEWQDDTPYDVRKAKKWNEYVKVMIDFVKAQDIRVHVDSVDIIREQKLYKWKVKDGKPIDEPLPLNDDLIKAVCYAIFNYSKQNNIRIGFVD